jgi:putative tryptophan/tyrosine transport system substrate-binding protein
VEGGKEKDMRKTIQVLTLCSLLLAPCSSAQAQQPKKVPRIVFIGPGSAASASAAYYDSFRQGLRELGYIEGKNIFIEARYAEGKQDQLFDLATELVKSNVDVIVTTTTPGVLAVKKATSTVPIVFAAAGDPVRAGLVSSLAHPGGNITGLSMFSTELTGKRLELLKEAFPKINRVAYMRDPVGVASGGLEETKAVANALGLRVQFLEVRSVKDFDKAFELILRERSQAIALTPLPRMNNYYPRIVEFAAKNRLPAIYPSSEFINAGGLMSYGVSFPDLFRRAATYVDKILKGAKPGELPVEQPTKFELVINLKAAKQIVVTIPQTVLYRADKVIR